MAYTAYDVQGNKRILLGLSSDTKPPLPMGDAQTILMETDTGSTSMWTGT
ncbi:MAG: hypothetical protein GY795_19065, partial [Desulfobacterales bacterium]|nr:hypothetical protein [Desulfobacterales bacterium]